MTWAGSDRWWEGSRTKPKAIRALWYTLSPRLSPTSADHSSAHPPVYRSERPSDSAGSLQSEKGQEHFPKMKPMALGRLKNRFLPHVPQSHPTSALLTARLSSFLLSSEASSAFPLPCQQHESKIQMPAGARKHVRSKITRSGGYCSTGECTQRGGSQPAVTRTRLCKRTPKYGFFSHEISPFPSIRSCF